MTTRKTRKKNGKKPNTVGKDCRYLKYVDGKAKCSLSVDGKNADCDKNKYCGYEPADSQTIDNLKNKLNGN